MNPAARILRLATKIKATESAENKSVPVWHNIIQQLTEKKRQSRSEISRFLMATQDEIDVLADALKDRGVPEALYIHHLSKIRSAIEPTSQGGAWSSVKSVFEDQRIDCLHWASLYLGDEEEEISAEDLKSLMSVIDELKTALKNNQIPNALRKSLQRHIENMEGAVADYPIKGIASIRTALETSTGMVYSQQDVYTEASQSTPGKNAIDTLKKMVNGAGRLLSAAGKNAESISKIGNAVETILKIMP